MLFAVKKKKNYGLHHLPFLIVIVLICCLFYFSDFVSTSNTTYNRDVLERGLNRSITQCYALEGMYPSTLSYLEDNYGLTYDKEHFYIDYQYIGSNLRPDVTIIEKD